MDFAKGFPGIEPGTIQIQNGNTNKPCICYLQNICSLYCTKLKGEQEIQPQ